MKNHWNKYRLEFQHLDIRFSCTILSQERECNAASQGVCAERQDVSALYNKQFDKLLHDVTYGGTHSANSRPFGIGVQKKRERRKGRGEVSEG